MLQVPIEFGSDSESHTHSLNMLELLDMYTDFMCSIDKMCDVGCGTGKDLEWWATRTVLDDNDNPEPLNIKCTGIDILEKLAVANQYTNIVYERRDFEGAPLTEKLFDVLYSHNSFQYAVNPLLTMRHFNTMLTAGGMLALSVPQNTNIVYHKQEFDQRDHAYFNYTLVGLIHMLAVSGFDCQDGFLKKNHEDPWLHAVVYKSQHEPMDPRTTSWHELAEKQLLPLSAVASLNKYGYVKMQSLVLPWLDKSNIDYGC